MALNGKPEDEKTEGISFDAVEPLREQFPQAFTPGRRKIVEQSHRSPAIDGMGPQLPEDPTFGS